MDGVLGQRWKHNLRWVEVLDTDWIFTNGLLHGDAVELYIHTTATGDVAYDTDESVCSAVYLRRNANSLNPPTQVWTTIGGVDAGKGGVPGKREFPGGRRALTHQPE